MNEPVPPIELDILIEAPPDVVYGILADPARFAAWIGATTGAFEPTPESPFRLEFAQYGTVISGEVLEATPSRRFSVSWGAMEGPQAESMPAGSTRLDIRLEPEQGGTRVKLRHSSLASEDVRTQHLAGWRFHLGRLELKANREFLATALEDVAPLYFEAWNESDGERRIDLLKQCCEQDIEFSDEYATVEGVDRLSLHIGNTHGYMTGTRIEGTNSPTVCRGEALQDWRLVDAAGNETQSGVNLLGMSSRGRIARVKGFWTG